MAMEKHDSWSVQEYLIPIKGTDPCGENLRYTDQYDKIKEARREEDEALPQGVWKKEVKKADWEQVAKICSNILIAKSKDLQVTAWLAEAWLNSSGLDGLGHGLYLLEELSKNFWTGIHPKIDNNNYDLRITPFEWVNSKLSEEVLGIDITIPQGKTSLAYSYMDWQDASRRERLRKAQAAAGAIPDDATGRVEISKVLTAIEQTPVDFYKDLVESLQKLKKIIANLEVFLKEQMNEEAPSFFRLREKLDLLDHFASGILTNRGEAARKADAIADEEVAKILATSSKISKLENRDQAYAQLEAIASYLEKVEPHSPTPYLIRRAIAWGNMSLNQVVVDMMGQNRDIHTLLYLLDIKEQ